MNVSLPIELEQYVEREIAAGKFRSPAEAVTEALWLLRRLEEQRDRLKNDLQLGIDQLDCGQYWLISSTADQTSLMQEIEQIGGGEPEKAID